MSIHSRILYFFDPSSEESERLAQALKRLVPDVEIRQCKTLSELKDQLEALARFPWGVVIRGGDPQSEGMQLISWIKRHPRLHFTPVFVALEGDASTVTQDSRSEFCNAGAFACISLPYTEENLKPVFEKRRRLEADPEEFDELDRIFSEEFLDRLASCREYLLGLNETSCRRLYHAFHTIKGSANTLEYRSLSTFMHRVEEFVGAVEEGRLFSLPETHEIGQAILRYLEAVGQAISTQVLIGAPSDELLQSIQKFSQKSKEQKAFGFRPREKPGGEMRVGPTAVVTPPQAPAHGNVRVTGESLDEIENRFRNILALRVHLSRFANHLKSEFFDEKFPDDLIALIDDLQREASSILEFFVHLRLVPLVRLRALAERVLAETTVQLDKATRLEFVCPPNLTVDQKIFECLENAVLHLLRNAVDHGIESIEVRARIGKEPIARVLVELRELGGDKIMAVFEDDGAGINIAAIRRLVAEHGALAGSVLDRMVPQEIAKLIFSDNLSTKRTASEISGRGVGLNSVKEQISELGGMIDLYFEEGKGTRFTIVLPRVVKE